MNEEQKLALVRQAFDAFNRRDFESALSLLDPDVRWPDFRGDIEMRGRDAVRRYWDELFAVATPSVLLGHVFAIGNDVLAVAYQQVHDADGHPIGEPSASTMRFSFSGELIAGMVSSQRGGVSDEILARFRSSDEE